MKNNRITFQQFCLSMFLSTLSVFLFIDYSPSLLCFAVYALALCVNLLVIYFYKGSFCKALKPLSAFYLAVFCTVITLRFCKYMQKDLGYGSSVILIFLLLSFSFFCAAKGLEPLCRASVIITPFVVFSVLFVALSSLGKINLSFELGGMKSFEVPFLLLYPSAIYILNSDYIIKEKQYLFPACSGLLFVMLVFFNLLPGNKVALNVFKGADGVFLALMTVAVLYYISGSAVALFKTFKHKYLMNSLYLSFVMIPAIVFVY